MSIIEQAPSAVHRGADEMPFVDIGDGNLLKVLQVDLSVGLWVIENVFQAGYLVQTHRHTGPVYAFTRSGAWMYQESPHEVNRAGSYLFEPAGSIHTLEVLEDNTQVWFSIYGANLNLDAAGNIESIFDAPTALDAYIALAEAEGYERPDVLITG